MVGPPYFWPTLGIENMAFFYDQLQMIFDLENGHSLVLDQHDKEALIVKLANNGFYHTYLLVNNFRLGQTLGKLDDFTEERCNRGDFVIGVVCDTEQTELAKFLFHFHKDTSINILKNLTNPTPCTATEQLCRELVIRFAPTAIYASEIQKREN